MGGAIGIREGDGAGPKGGAAYSDGSIPGSGCGPAGTDRTRGEGMLRAAAPQQGEVEMCRWSGYLMAGG